MTAVLVDFDVCFFGLKCNLSSFGIYIFLLHARSSSSSLRRVRSENWQATHHAALQALVFERSSTTARREHRNILLALLDRALSRAEENDQHLCDIPPIGCGCRTPDGLEKTQTGCSFVV